MKLLSGIAIFVPEPFGSSFRRIVNVFDVVLRAVTSYSLPSSPDKCVKEPKSDEESEPENAMISPTFIENPARSTSSTTIVVSPIAVDESFTRLLVPKCCSYARVFAQSETPIELPCTPAVLAAKSPTEASPLENEPR